ncbi:hypothetical protein HW555_001928 [Spodoptera exigua]|uniref:FP protein C-terminal domain-containing protein n=1 Tax=Spodoptera exigua TaxID=7107 RepID=A0A835GRF4_SPOEX|nr:hypothetical protein HW555_001928 [Spodoptera exigua]
MSTVRSTPRSPTMKQTNNTCLSQAKSESDIANVVAIDHVNINRNKRARRADSPQEPTSLSSHDLQTLLADAKDDHQDSPIAKVLTTQTALMAKLAADISVIKTQNTQIQSANSDIKKTNEEIVKSMSFINHQFEELKKEVEDLRRERREQSEYIVSLEKKIQDLQHKSRSSGIEIRNIPQASNESSTALTKTLCVLGDAVGVSVKDSDLRDVYRLPGKSSSPTSTTRPIIAEFSSVMMKDTLISAVRTFNKSREKQDKLNTGLLGISGTKHPVYVTEQLPGNTKKLYYLSREFAKSNNFKFCWVSNGNIFLRKHEGDKQLLIRSENCLQVIGNASK